MDSAFHPHRRTLTDSIPPLALLGDDFVLVHPSLINRFSGSSSSDHDFVDPWAKPKEFGVQLVPAEFPMVSGATKNTKYLVVTEYPDAELAVWEFKLRGPNDRPKITPVGAPCFGDADSPDAFFTAERCCSPASAEEESYCWSGPYGDQRFICCAPYLDAFTDAILAHVPDYSYDNASWTAWKNAYRVGHHLPPNFAWNSTEFRSDEMLELYDLTLQAGVPEAPVGYINIGASNGISSDPLYDLILARRLAGIAVEQDGGSYNQLIDNLDEVANRTRTINEWATPSNIQELILEHVDLWPAGAPTRDLFVLKIDIDSWECPLMESAVEVVSPYFIHVETNQNYPPPVEYAVGHNASVVPQYDDSSFIPTAGCSLSYVVKRMMERGYYLYAMYTADAVLIRKDIAPRFEALHPGEYNAQGEMTSPPLKFPMDEFEVFRQMKIWVFGVNVQVVSDWFFNMHTDPEKYLESIRAMTSEHVETMNLHDVPILMLNVTPTPD